MLVSAIGQTKQQIAKLILQCHINSFDAGDTYFYICCEEVPGSKPKERLSLSAAQVTLLLLCSTQLQVEVVAVLSIGGIQDYTEEAPL